MPDSWHPGQLPHYTHDEKQNARASSPRRGTVEKKTYFGNVVVSRALRPLSSRSIPRYSGNAGAAIG